MKYIIQQQGDLPDWCSYLIHYQQSLNFIQLQSTVLKQNTQNTVYLQIDSNATAGSCVSYVRKMEDKAACLQTAVMRNALHPE